MVNIWQGFWEMEMNIHRSQLFWCETQRYCLVLFGIDQIDLWKGCSNGWRRALERDGKVDGRAGKPRAYLGTKFQGWSFGATCSSQIFFSWFVARFLFGWSHFFTGSGFLTTNFSTILSLKIFFGAIHCQHSRYGEQIQEMNFKELVDLAKKANADGLFWANGYALWRVIYDQNV